ncbi:MAG: right-handed parallel beta-helix repeat-containing protein [Candidatus Njordarchaeia archaeon]
MNKRILTYIVVIIVLSVLILTDYDGSVSDSHKNFFGSNYKVSSIIGTPPPSSGDWIINDITVVEGETIVLDANITVKNTGALILKNSIIKMDVDVKGEHNITVYGNLTMISSTITSNDGATQYIFECADGSKIRIESSEIGYVYPGFSVFSNYIVIKNSKIHHNEIGLYSAFDSAIIIGNEFYANEWGIETMMGNSIFADNIIHGSSAYGFYGYYMENTIIYNNKIYDNDLGVYLVTCNNITIQNNVFEDNEWFNLKFFDSVNNTITNNRFLYSSIPWSTGLEIEGTNNLTITKNIFDNNKIGIDDPGHNTTIIGNNFTNNLYGISINYYRNISCYQNNFINNTYDVSYLTSPTLYLDNGTVGNYWDKYNGSDSDLDGIGDTPYRSSNASHNFIDRYPLMTPADFWGPEISEIMYEPTQPSDIDPVTVSAKVKDPSGVNSVILSYYNGTWVNTTMSYNSSLGKFVGQVPAISGLSSGKFKIYAEDNKGNWKESDETSYDIIPSTLPPAITEVVFSPLEPTSNDNVTVYARVWDPNGVGTVILSYRSDGVWTNITMSYYSATSKYKGEIPSMSSGKTVHFKIYASDGLGNWAESEEYSYTVTGGGLTSSWQTYLLIGVAAVLVIAAIIMILKKK